MSDSLAAAAMPSLYRSADAFVLPTRGEAWCRPVMEAMLMELPVIVTKWGGHMEYVRPRNAYLLDYQLKNITAAQRIKKYMGQSVRTASPRLVNFGWRGIGPNIAYRIRNIPL